ncbi:hypothetical protein KIN20_012555 [Parelaphostrongylus tenuis]|uniref:Uncharacterized protein n=1 Tax=Parelaphostrongylus tenuis TaxID=148309 RepID=A0AAD5MAY8_PARTN|nr:hypothetical protein KIN20_012555 [Parelaphostrongylus tenuis]
MGQQVVQITGRLHKVDRDAVIEAIEEGPTLIIEELANDLVCGHAIISSILKTVGK